MTNQSFLTRHSLPTVHNIPRHFTASALVIANNHILLIHHRRIGAWLPPGGHIETDELPHHAAERETLEETGVVVAAVCEPLPDTKNSDAFILPAPLCMHCVRATEQGVDLYHIDIAYLCKPVPDALELPIISSSDEVNAARWFSLDELSTVSLAKNVVEVLELANRRYLV